MARIQLKNNRRYRIQITMSRRLWERYQAVLELAKRIKADIDFTTDFEVWFGKQLDQVEPELQKHLSPSPDKAGLQAAKARGKKLGTNNLKPELIQEASAKGVTIIKQNADSFARKVLSVIEGMHSQGKSLRAIARELDSLGVLTARGGKWTPTAVKNVLARIKT